MEITLKILLLLFALASVAALLGGCSAPRARGDVDLFRAYTRVDRNYFADRGYDLLDVVSASVEGPVIGASVTLGPAKFGLMRSTHPTLEGKGGVGIGLATEKRLSGFGLRCGQVGTYAHEENVFGFAWDTPPDYGGGTRAYLRAKTGADADGRYARRTLYARVGAAVGLGLGLRLEFNAGELADFFLGAVGVDLMQDDLGRKLRGVEHLDLGYAQLQALSPQIGDFATLRTLSLESNTLQELPESCARLQNLRSLNLAQNQFSQFPVVLASLTRLDTLELGSNQLTGTLSPQIGGLAALTTLTLYYNQLESLPDALGQLTNLTRLQLGNNRLQSLPAAIGRLEHLLYLNAESNQLQRLPATIGQLPLQELVLWNNRLAALPAEIGKIPTLETLNLGKNALAELPSELGNLTYLESLQLQENQLRTLPASLANLTALSSLNLSGNPLGTLPAAILALQSLRELQLDRIGLALLPPEIARLQSLRRLSLDGNQLTTLPLEALAQLPNLEGVYLRNNNFSCAEMKRIYRTLGYRVDFGDAFYACPDHFSTEE